jgi:transposase
MEEKTAFIQIFGDSPILRVLDFLVVNEEFDYSMTDIAHLSGIGYSTLKLFWEKLEKEGCIANTRTVGKAKMYKLNASNPMMKKFREFYWETTKQSVRQKLKKEEIIVGH